LKKWSKWEDNPPLLMNDILQNNTFHLRWHDDEHTVLVLNVKDRWDWDAAYLAIERISQAAASIDHDFYTVFLFEKSSSMLPRDYVIPNTRNLMIETPNERLVLLVNANRFLEIIVNMVAKGLPAIARKIRFVPNLECALQAIEQHKATFLSQPKR
jgi:hypothetical protein